MKKFLQKAFAMLVLCLVSMSAMAQEPDVTFTINMSTPDPISLEIDGVTLTGRKGSNALNLYSPWGWHATVSCEDFPITKVEMIGPSGSLFNQLSPTGDVGGSYTYSVPNHNFTWTGSANSVTFSSNNGDYYISSVKVWLDKSSGGSGGDRENVMDVASTFFSTGNVEYIRTNLTFVTDIDTETEHSGYNGSTNEVPAGITFKDGNDNDLTNKIQSCLWWENSNQVVFNLTEQITTPGNYTLTIPAGVIPCVGNKANKEIVFNWTVLTPAPAFPEESKAYLLKNVDYNQYLNIVNDETTAARLYDDPEPLYFTWDGSKAQFTIEDEEGNYIGTSSTSWNVGSTTPEYWTVQDIGDGKYALKAGSGIDTYLGFDDGMGGRTYYAAFRGKYSANHVAFYFEEYVPAPVAVATFDMSAAGWATLCIGQAFTVPTGYTAYVAGELDGDTPKLVEDGEIILTPITNVPAWTPVILQGEEANGVELFAPATPPAAVVVNYLVGNTGNTALTMNASGFADRGFGAYDWENDEYEYGVIGACQLYQLAKENGKVGFYRQVEGGATIECAAHKAILAVPNAVAAASNGRLLFPGQDDVTGINAIATDKAEAIYNLQGQRVNATKAGVYVKNGKKFIVK